MSILNGGRTPGWIAWMLLLPLVLISCEGGKTTLDVGTLNATRYPAVAVNEATVEAMKLARPTQGPAPTKSPLDMTATNPADFQLKSGQLQFIEFFRYG